MLPDRIRQHGRVSIDATCQAARTPSGMQCTCSMRHVCTEFWCVMPAAQHFRCLLKRSTIGPFCIQQNTSSAQRCRARAKLQQEHREQIDRTLAQLVPAFDLRSQQQQQQLQQQHNSAEDDNAPNQQQQQQQQVVELSEAMQDGLEHMYLPVAALCNKGKHKALQVQQEAGSAAADAVAADSAAAGGSDQGSGEEEIEGRGEAEIQPAAAPPSDATSRVKEDKADQVALNSSSRVEALLTQALSSLQSAAVKSLAEVSAGQLMMMLALGRSVAAVPR